MNIDKLRIVLLLEKYKKVTDAAAELNLKQPTVSFHMKSLEAEMGTRLFLYRGGRVLLTEAGRMLHQYAVRIVSLADEAQRSVSRLASSGEGILKLEASPILSDYVIPGRLALFFEQHPEAELALSVHSDRDLARRLQSGDSQLVALHSGGDLPAGWEQTPIARDETLLVFAPDDPLGDDGRPPMELIASARWLHHMPGYYLRDKTEDWARLNGLLLRKRAESSSPESLKRMAAQGHGVAVMSKSSVQRELADGTLASRVLPGIVPEEGHFRLCWRKDYSPTPLESEAIKWLGGSRSVEE